MSDISPGIRVVALGRLVSPDLVTLLDRIGVLSVLVVRATEKAWLAAIVTVDDTWTMPASRRRRDVLTVAAALLRRLAGSPSELPEVPVAPLVISADLQESIQDAARRIRISRLTDWDPRSSKHRATIAPKVFRILRDISPALTPIEVADSIVRLAFRYGLPSRMLFEHWFAIHRMGTDDVVVAGLASGRRIYLEGELSEQIDPLMSAILSDAMDNVVRHPRPKSWSWQAELDVVFREIGSAVERTVMKGTHPEMAQFLLWTLLDRDIRDRFIGYLKLAFPYLDSDSREACQNNRCRQARSGTATRTRRRGITRSIAQDARHY